MSTSPIVTEPAVEAIEPGHAVHERRLARAGGAHDGGELAGREVDVDVVEGEDLGVAACRRSWWRRGQKPQRSVVSRRRGGVWRSVMVVPFDGVVWTLSTVRNAASRGRPAMCVIAGRDRWLVARATPTGFAVITFGGGAVIHIAGRSAIAARYGRRHESTVGSAMSAARRWATRSPGAGRSGRRRGRRRALRRRRGSRRPPSRCPGERPADALAYALVIAGFDQPRVATSGADRRARGRDRGVGRPSGCAVTARSCRCSASPALYAVAAHDEHRRRAWWAMASACVVPHGRGERQRARPAGRLRLPHAAQHARLPRRGRSPPGC